MSIPGSAIPLLLASAAEAGAYQIERSVRFNSADSAYLSRTPSVAGNRKTWTWAGWVKRSALGAGHLFVGYVAGNDNQILEFRFSNDQLHVAVWTTQLRVTTQVFRDTSAWAHVVLAVDTTQAVANDRVKLYWNGAQITQFATTNNPAQNADLGVNQAGLHTIGREWTGTTTLNGYLADVHFIDGQALDPTSFGEFDANGVWQPKAYTGSYPGNSFHLPFSDNSTAAALGTDTSGNSNNWTVNNISVAAGAGNDSLVDTPTSYDTDTGAGGEVRGNYCTLNPLSKDSNTTLSNGNLDAAGLSSSAFSTNTQSTFALSVGKWYYETTLSATSSSLEAVGWIRTSLSPTGNPTAGSALVYRPTYGDYFDLSGTNYASKPTTSVGGVIQVAIDFDAGKIWFGSNGSWFGSGNPATGSNPAMTFTAGAETLSPGLRALAATFNFNFGQRPFAYTAPSGFKALCTTSLPAPVVAKPSEVMDVVTYTGNGSTQTISGLGFSPDLVWIKSRSQVSNHLLHDVIRGATNTLYSNLTSQEEVNANALTSFNSDGFAIGNLGGINTSAASYVAWAWDAGSSTVTNTRGSITSSVRANPSAGFSIVAYTGTGSNASVGHGLGVAPAFIIAKKRNGTSDWLTNGPGLAAPWGGALQVNTTSAFIASSGIWLSLSPTSQVFFIGTADAVNYPAATHVAYCFAPVAGYSAFGSYTGNGSADGPFVYTGFRPRWILIKRADVAENWILHDTARDPYNVTTAELLPNSSLAEGNTTPFDILSNGFKIRTGTNVGLNINTGVYTYAAFAEHPFQFSRAR